MVHCDFTGSMNEAILHGVRVAGIFKKELCLFHPIEKGDKGTKLEAQKKLGNLIRKLKKKTHHSPISSLTLKGDLKDTINQATEQYDAIMLVLTPENIKKKLPALQQSPIPFLFVKGNNSEYLKYSQIMLPVDFRKVMKDTALWASYFGRFNQASISLLSAQEKNQETAEQTEENVRSIKELLVRLNLNVQHQTAENGSFRLPFEALGRCTQGNGNLLIIPSSQHISLIDLLAGLPESRIIRQAGSLPVLCINPRRDMYILCD